jgi:hypothetical protein
MTRKSLALPTADPTRPALSARILKATPGTVVLVRSSCNSARLAFSGSKNICPVLDARPWL